MRIIRYTRSKTSTTTSGEAQLVRLQRRLNALETTKNNTLTTASTGVTDGTNSDGSYDTTNNNE